MSRGVIVMLQQGQVFRLRGGDGRDVWAFRYRLGGRGSRRVQRGGFASERDASEALERALERVRRERGCGSALTLGELVDEYLAQHDGEPETIEKLRWLLTKATRIFGTRRLPELRSQAIAAWRMTVPPGHRLRRPKRAFARCRYRRSRSQRSSNCPPLRAARFCFRRFAAATSICTTSATVTGNPPSALHESRRSAPSTLCATPSRSLPFVPASPPSTFPATWAPASP